MSAYREIAPYEVANARAKVMLEELHTQRRGKTTEVRSSPQAAEQFLAGLTQVPRRSLAFCEHVGRKTREAFS